MKYFISVNGFTGVGKSVATDYLSKQLEARYIHPIYLMKCFFEDLVGLKRGALDTAKGKNYIPIGSTHNMHTILKEIYHTFKEYWPNYSIFDMSANIDSNCFERDALIFASIRNFTEVEFLEDLKNEGYTHIHIIINRDVETLSSDEHVVEINERLKKSSDYYYVIENNSSLNDFFKKLKSVKESIEEIIK